MINFSSIRFGYTPMRPTNQNEPHQGPATETKFSSSDTFAKSGVRFGGWFDPKSTESDENPDLPAEEGPLPTETWIG